MLNARWGQATGRATVAVREEVLQYAVIRGRKAVITPSRLGFEQAIRLHAVR